MRRQAYACCGVPVEVRKQLLGVYFLLSPWEARTKGRSSGYQVSAANTFACPVLGDGRDQAPPFEG